MRVTLPDAPHKPPPLEIGLLLLLGILWGVPFALTKISLETIPPVTLTAARVSLAAATLWLIVLQSRLEVPHSWKFIGRLFMQGALACVIPYTLIAFGQRSVDSSLAAILNSTTPLFVCLIGLSWTRHEAITIGRLSGALLGFAGVVVVVGAVALAGLGQPTFGQVAIVLATVASAASVIHGRRFIGVAPELVAAGTLTCAAIILLPLSLLIDGPWRTAPSTASLAALIGNAIGATALGFVIYFRLIRTIGSMGTASAGYLKPAVGVIMGCLLLGEPWTWALILGLPTILIGIAAINGNMFPARLPQGFSLGAPKAKANPGLSDQVARSFDRGIGACEQDLRQLKSKRSGGF